MTRVQTHNCHSISIELNIYIKSASQSLYTFNIQFFNTIPEDILDFGLVSNNKAYARIFSLVKTKNPRTFSTLAKCLIRYNSKTETLIIWIEIQWDVIGIVRHKTFPCVFTLLSSCRKFHQEKSYKLEYIEVKSGRSVWMCVSV